MATLGNYLFRPLLAIFGLSSRQIKTHYIYNVCARGAEISTYGPYCVK